MREYIHGGDEGALFGARDFVAAFASKEIIELQTGEVLTGSVWKGC